MDLLDSGSEEPKSKLRRYVITAVALAVLVALSLGYTFRFHTEKKTVDSFFQTLARGDTREAYRIWKPHGSYTFQDFLEDWGPAGYYGPVKSYRIVTAEQVKSPKWTQGGASGVVVVVEVSPDSPFPQDSEKEKVHRIKEVKIWVERKDQSLSYPP